MARFKGIPVQGEQSAPRFKGEALPSGGRHLSFEEGQALLDREDANSVWDETGAILTGAANGIPLAGPYIERGLENAAAGIASVIDGEDFSANLKQGREASQLAAEVNPLARLAGQVAGGVIGTAPMVAAAPTAFGVGAASVPRAMLASGASGTAIGAADGYVRDGTEGAISGGVVGGVLGAAGPAVGNLAGRAWRSIANSRAQNEAARIAGTQRPAVDVVARALAADEAVGATNANIANAGPRAMLADAGPSTLSVLDTSIQRGGPQAGRAAQRITDRAAGASDDIGAALDTALGPEQGMIRPLEELRTATQPARAAAYDAAYAQPINYADQRGMLLERTLRGRVPASVVSRANNLMRVNGEESQQILARVADDGTVTFERLPDVRQIDYITRALQDVARAGDGAGALGGNTAEGRAYGGLARELRNILSSLVPEYRTALDTAAEPIAQREATLFGQRILSPAVARDEVEGFVTGLSNAELRSLQGGVRSKISETLANVKRSVTDGNIDARQGVAALRELSSDAARQKITTILGARQADNLMRAVDQAARSFEVRAGVAANSRTYARQAAERAVDQATAPSFIENAASGRPVASARGFLQSLLGTGEPAQLARQDETWGEIANILTQPAGMAQGTFLRALQAAAQQIPVADRQAANLARGVTTGTAISSAPARRLMGQ
ncbi:hypothetical protein E5S70_17690 [Ensifer adhaerens]|uniref:hypothetical protein n=1 Tax=Ensifer canadensis TaxID=555315 RepID=UPI001490815C|nr:hypothetical protein [Ensifer canadensis]NOV17885.1 hypothetical protein [Ensifer canadensis]